jgi:two-component system KDP operon response regulator KdpE
MEPAIGPASLESSILIVDDERATRHTLADLLRRTGYRTEEAASGREALESIARQHFDLVILDLKMPEMDGTEVLRAARPLSPDTVFIILTAYGTLDSARVAIRHGAFDYLLKPSSMPEIVRVVEAGLAQQRQKLVQENPLILFERALEELKSHSKEPKPAPAPERFLQAPEVNVDVLRRLVVVCGEPVDLTPTEFDILVYLLRYRDRVVSSRELVAHLRGCELDERDARVVLRAHMHRLRYKLERDPSHPRIICTVRGSGYRIGDNT